MQSDKCSSELEMIYLVHTQNDDIEIKLKNKKNVEFERKLNIKMCPSKMYFHTQFHLILLHLISCMHLAALGD